MNRFRTALRAALPAGAALAVAAGTLGLAAPAAQAAAFDMPTPTLAYTAADQGSATANSGAYVWIGANTSLQVSAGSVVTGKMGTVTFGDGQTKDGVTLSWFSCPSRGAALAGCTTVRTITSDAISATLTSFAYTTTAADTGRYLAYSVTQRFKTAAGASASATAVSDRTQDLQVIAPLGSTTRPVLGIANVQPGGKAGLLVFPWTLPAGGTFAGRAVTVFACPDANAGQVASATWSTSGCTQIADAGVTGNVNANAGGALQVQTTAAMAGQTLVAQVLLTFRATNNVTTIYAIRSAGATLPGAAAATATPSPTPSASANADAGSVANQIPTGSPSAAVLAASPVVPKVKIVAVKTITRGKSTGVAIELSGRGKGTVGVGSAIVELVKTGAPGEKASQKLKTTSIKGMKGFQKQTLSKKLKKGTYYLRVIYTDAKSKVQAGALKKVSVK